MRGICIPFGARGIVAIPRVNFLRPDGFAKHVAPRRKTLPTIKEWKKKEKEAE